MAGRTESEGTVQKLYVILWRSGAVCIKILPKSVYFSHHSNPNKTVCWENSYEISHHIQRTWHKDERCMLFPADPWEKWYSLTQQVHCCKIASWLGNKRSTQNGPAIYLLQNKLHRKLRNRPFDVCRQV